MLLWPSQPWTEVLNRASSHGLAWRTHILKYQECDTCFTVSKYPKLLKTRTKEIKPTGTVEHHWKHVSLWWEKLDAAHGCGYKGWCYLWLSTLCGPVFNCNALFRSNVQLWPRALSDRVKWGWCVWRYVVMFSQFVLTCSTRVPWDRNIMSKRSRMFSFLSRILQLLVLACHQCEIPVFIISIFSVVPFGHCSR